MVLFSSIGVERSEDFPFKILNLYGVLDSKLEAEQIFVKAAAEIGSKAIIVRPGRLVGAPFTNSDLAKLFQIDQGKNQGLIVDTRDILAGDVERRDVAEFTMRLLQEESLISPAKFSIINKPGSPPSDVTLGKLFSLFTVPPNEVKTTRIS
jgi:hypothetical protein